MKKVFLGMMLLAIGFTSSIISFDAAQIKSVIHDCSSGACNWTSASSFHSYILRDDEDIVDIHVRASASNYDSSSTFRVEAKAGGDSDAHSGNGVSANASCGSFDFNCNHSQTGNAIFGI